VIGSNGDLDFYRRLPKFCPDFRPHVVNGKTFYSMALSTPSKDVLESWIGSRTIVDQNFQVVRELPGPLDMHEFVLIGENHYLSIEVPLERTRSGLLYANRTVREYRDGKAVFEWGVSDYIKQIGSGQAAGGFFFNIDGEAVADICHLNTAQSINENEVLVGLGECGITLIDKKTKKMKWLLGGFDDQFQLSYQQQPTLTHMADFNPRTGKLLVFSNRTAGNPISYTPSRVLEYTLDTENKRVKEFKVIRSADEISPLMSSVQVDGDIYSIGYGSNVLTGPSFVEYQNGKVQFSLSFRQRLAAFYRVYRTPYGSHRN
jgi:hypothetical protein